ncbi:hypothetical protein [Aminobacter sp. AP02]|uniref:hypothetical protein n=1 Tax=Aminobacter sp. AP02 TaxID=2135737 RepID=UPI000D6BDADE|nr:hypothetical protein [Aminobacter sp. AP02]PWK65876.1 hypothetical protein C8K44_11591 [Aminobacter sp. AP02]
MSNLTNIAIKGLSHDSTANAANFNITCRLDDEPASIMGRLPVPTSGDLKESEVTALSKAALADLLEAIAAHLRSAA